MGSPDIRRYSPDEIDAMIEAGDYVPTPADAPTHDFDDAFWAMVERNLDSQSKKQSVHLRLDPETLAFFKSKGPDYLAQMAATLRDTANRKKAS